MKKLLQSKSFLTAVSILSVLLIFALLCGGSMMILHELGLMDLPSDGNEVVIPNAGNDGVGALPLYTEAYLPAAEIDADIHACDRLLAAMPFVDGYYMKLQVDSDQETGRFASGLYEIWRHGNRYRIHRYRIGGDAASIMVSDGERVQITNFDDITVFYDTYSEAYAFEKVAPLPDFEENFARHEHRLVSHRRVDDRRVMTYEYPLSGENEEIDVYSDTGMLLYYSRVSGEKTILAVNVITADIDFRFSDYMFSFD